MPLVPSPPDGRALEGPMENRVEQGRTAVAQGYALAASSPHSQGHCLNTSCTTLATKPWAMLRPGPQRPGLLCLPDVLMDERDELLKRLLGSRGGDIPGQEPFALLEQRQVDLATGPAVLQDELIEVRAGMRRVVGA